MQLVHLCRRCSKIKRYVFETPYIGKGELKRHVGRVAELTTAMMSVDDEQNTTSLHSQSSCIERYGLQINDTFWVTFVVISYSSGAVGIPGNILFSIVWLRRRMTTTSSSSSSFYLSKTINYLSKNINRANQFKNTYNIGLDAKVHVRMFNRLHVAHKK